MLGQIPERENVPYVEEKYEHKLNVHNRRRYIEDKLNKLEENIKSLKKKLLSLYYLDF